MAKLQESSKQKQMELLVVPIINVSKSMKGEKISSVNEAMSNFASQLLAIEENEINVLIAPLVFSSKAQWIKLNDNNPVRPADFIWEDISADDEEANLGSAYELLYEKLQTKENGGWMQYKDKGLCPIILLISDNSVSHSANWQKSYEHISGLFWFQWALRFVIKIESNDALESFVKCRENIYDVHHLRHDVGCFVHPIVCSYDRYCDDEPHYENEPVTPQSNEDDTKPIEPIDFEDLFLE